MAKKGTKPPGVGNPFYHPRRSALILGLKSIIKDKRSKPAEKLRACELLYKIEYNEVKLATNDCKASKLAQLNLTEPETEQAGDASKDECKTYTPTDQ